MMMHRLFVFSISVVVLGLVGMGGCNKPVPSVLCYFDKDCPANLPVCESGVCTLEGSTGEGGGSVDGGGPEAPGTTCATGQRKSCYKGPAGTENKGICRSGEQLCVRGIWDICEGERLPETETCDGLDNDCNGLVDEVCQKCKPGAKQACYTGTAGSQGKGACKAGSRICLGTQQWGDCQGQVIPSAEVCDSVDNNCDGKIDEGCPGCQAGQTRACYTGTPSTKGVGACKTGAQTCANQKWGACKGQVLPSAELCDKIDNDCDGKVDVNCQECSPGTTKPCYPSGPGCVGAKCTGSCKLGVRRCTPIGKWGHCEGAVTPQIEVCNGKDDNCNGRVDDKPKPVYCPNQRGACAGTTRRCIAGRSIACVASDYTNHNPKIAPGPDATCDGIDNNCNGKTDEDCVKGCQPGAVKSCYSGPPSTLNKGICRAGKQTCQANKAWGPCAQQVLPSAEICNKKDDDCDGYVDESYPEQGKFCQTGRPGICASGLYHCVKGSVQCKTLVQPRPEICNGKDDDCDGKIDNGASTRTYYKDFDGDNYGDPNQPIKACLRPSGYVSNKDDCYDKNANVRPGQFGFFVNHRGDGSFDYNCDNKETKRFTKKGDCKKCQSPVISNGFVNPQAVACGKSGNWVDKCRSDVGRCYPITTRKYQTCR